MSARAVIVALTLLAAGCASAGVARPSPFPGAPPPPEAAPRVQPMAAPAPSPTRGDDIADTALAYRGVPYVLGGESPKTGFDCSGLVQYVFAAHAIDVPRTVAEQYRVGTPVRLTDLQPGDLVFFSTTGRGATHVGIAISRDQFVHAPTSNGVVRVEPVDSPYWHQRFVGARRMSALH